MFDTERLALTPPPASAASTVPDAVRASFLEAAGAVLDACWATADLPQPQPVPPGFPRPVHPRWAISDAVNALSGALASATSGDGSDAVIGFALVARSMAAKAVGMREAGLPRSGEGPTFRWIGPMPPQEG